MGKHTIFNYLTILPFISRIYGVPQVDSGLVRESTRAVITNMTTAQTTTSTSTDVTTPYYSLPTFAPTLTGKPGETGSFSRGGIKGFDSLWARIVIPIILAACCIFGGYIFIHVKRRREALERAAAADPAPPPAEKTTKTSSLSPTSSTGVKAPMVDQYPDGISSGIPDRLEASRRASV